MASRQTDMFSGSPFREVLDAIDARAKNSTEKGDMFEVLTREFFKNDAVWRDRFDDVWLWMEWPDRGGRPDAGADLVAKNADDDGYTAIQAKFYPAGGYISKADMDSFISNSGISVPGGPRFTRRIFVCVGANWTTNAEEALN